MKLSVDQALRKAALLARQSKAEEARAIYAEVLQRFPANRRAAEGIAGLRAAVVDVPADRLPDEVQQLARQERYEELADLGPDLLARHPNNVSLLRLLGTVNLKFRRFTPASAIFELILQLRPGDGEAYHGLGQAMFGLGRQDEALNAFETATRIQPDMIEALYHKGVLQRAMGRLEDALVSFDGALRRNPALVDGHNNRAVILQELGRPEQALASFDEALRLQPGRADLHYNRAVILGELLRLEEAVAGYDRVVELEPDFIDAHRNRGELLCRLLRYPEAIAAYDNVLRLAPDHFAALHTYAAILRNVGKSSEALAALDRGLRQAPSSAGLHNSKGIALQDLSRIEEALASYDAALRFQPDFADALNNRGTVLEILRRSTEAEASYTEAIRLAPDMTQAYVNRGGLYVDTSRRTEAIADFEQALRLNPAQSTARVQLMHQRAQICDWSGWADGMDVRHVGVDGEPAPPFALLSLEDAPLRHLERAKRWATAFTAKGTPSFVRPSSRPERLNIGYFSSDFYNHATMYLLARLIEVHDRSRFRIHAFSIGPDPQDDMHRRLVAGADVFHEARDLGDQAVAELARDQAIHIAVDLKGYTRGARAGIFANRCAPIQMNYLGYPGSMGADFMDYVIADPVVVDDGRRAHYSEKVIRLPHCYQPNDDQRPISTHHFSRGELDLPEAGFVFCCFNNSYKITPDEFDVWMRLLRAVDGSVLWLLESNSESKANLFREAQVRGVAADRLVFAPKLSHAEHLARHRCADLFLDTFRYNAHTTASDALWAGLPMVTLLGDGFAARVGGSLLGAVGLGELITRSVAEYEDLALKLANDPARCAQLREKLDKALSSAPLFDSARTARDLEQAFDRAYQNLVDGFAPDHIDVT